MFGRATLSVYRYLCRRWVERRVPARQASPRTSVSVFYALACALIGSDVRFSVRIDTADTTQAILDRSRSVAAGSVSDDDLQHPRRRSARSMSAEPRPRVRRRFVGQHVNRKSTRSRIPAASSATSRSRSARSASSSRARALVPCQSRHQHEALEALRHRMERAQPRVIGPLWLFRSCLAPSATTSSNARHRSGCGLRSWAGRPSASLNSRAGQPKFRSARSACRSTARKSTRCTRGLSPVVLTTPTRSRLLRIPFPSCSVLLLIPCFHRIRSSRQRLTCS